MADQDTLRNTKHPFSYRPEYRLKRRKDFLHMEQANIRLQTRPFVLILISSEAATSRLGIVVTKRIDKRAVVRNAIRRKAREIFRQCRSRFKSPHDLLVIAKKNAIDCPFSTMSRQVNAALYQHGFLDGITR